MYISVCCGSGQPEAEFNSEFSALSFELELTKSELLKVTTYDLSVTVIL